MSSEPVSLIGAGAVGTVLARRLASCGYAVRAIINRTEERARQVAAQIQAPVASSSLADLPGEARLVFCCVPDDALPEVAEQLASVRSDWSGCAVAHTSGVLPAQVLAPLDEHGAQVLSFHPLQAFTRESGATAFDGIYVGLEGAEQAVQRGRRIAEDLGARPLELSKEAKAQYHLGASIASNFLVTLMAMAGEVLRSTSADLDDPAAPFYPLVEGTLRNLMASTPEEALTGPVVRADRGTLETHLDTLKTHDSHLLSVYVALAVESIRLAVRSGRLSPEKADPLLTLLQKYV